MDLKTDIYEVHITQPVVIIKVCDTYRQTFVCEKQITEKYVKKCIGKAITGYVLGD